MRHRFTAAPAAVTILCALGPLPASHALPPDEGDSIPTQSREDEREVSCSSGSRSAGRNCNLGSAAATGAIECLCGAVDTAEGGEGIRRQIITAVPELLAKAKIDRGQLRGAGVGFGGPTDDATQSVIKSHHIEGWHGFPLAEWMSKLVGVPTVICNDADVAGLAEAQFARGRGFRQSFTSQSEPASEAGSSSMGRSIVAWGKGPRKSDTCARSIR